ncbi:MAG: hypothetical protein LEGION0403_FIIPPAGN_01566 [Legionella sp.]|uniref:hypothetical protein n=1 Tax=Legionella sp. TaxID=459 RepID=UPI003D121190
MSLFNFDDDLNAKLSKGLKQKLGKSRKALFFKNINKINDKSEYQSQFITKVQEKLGNAATDEVAANYIGSDFLKANMQFVSRYIKPRDKPCFDVGFLIMHDKQNPDKIKLGLLVGTKWFVSFEPSGLVACEQEWDEADIYYESIITLRDNGDILSFLKRLTGYVSACNGSMDYDKKEFNEAHFVMYFLEYSFWWEKTPDLIKNYLNEFSVNQKLPNIIELSENFGKKVINLTQLCSEYGVEKQELPSENPKLIDEGKIVLKADDSQKLDALFCRIIELYPGITTNFRGVARMTELVQYMTITEHGRSDITTPRGLFGFPSKTVNWPEAISGLMVISEEYKPFQKPLNKQNTELTSLNEELANKSTYTSKYQQKSSFFGPWGKDVSPIQGLLNNAEKKEEGEYLQLKFSNLSDLEKLQQELSNIGRLAADAQSVMHLSENGKDVFIMKLSKTDYDAIMGKDNKQCSIQ